MMLQKQCSKLRITDTMCKFRARLHSVKWQLNTLMMQLKRRTLVELLSPSHQDEIAKQLQKSVEARLARAGIQVLEARISYLAYSTEIAQAMLRRQQASAVVAARREIVDGAVGMVELALQQLSTKGIIELDEDKKATMVSNLLVVLCSETDTTPVVNTGTLYQ